MAQPAEGQNDCVLSSQRWSPRPKSLVSILMRPMMVRRSQSMAQGILRHVEDIGAVFEVEAEVGEAAEVSEVLGTGMPHTRNSHSIIGHARSRSRGQTLVCQSRMKSCGNSYL